MTVQGQLRLMLKTVAAALGQELNSRLVFVGGCTTALFITDPVTLEDVRATDDVDLIMDILGHGNWVELEKSLLERGFSVSPEDDVVCRRRLGSLKVDFMPDDEKILGFTNQWYSLGIQTAIKYQIAEDLWIRHLTPPIFVATKLEAYLGRGANDPMSSHDLEDVLIVIDGRKELNDEIRSADEQVRTFISNQLEAFQSHPDFDSFIDGNMRRNPGRAKIVRNRISTIIDGSIGKEY